MVVQRIEDSFHQIAERRRQWSEVGAGRRKVPVKELDPAFSSLGEDGIGKARDAGRVDQVLEGEVLDGLDAVRQTRQRRGRGGGGGSISGFGRIAVRAGEEGEDSTGGSLFPAVLVHCRDGVAGDQVQQQEEGQRVDPHRERQV